ncbi:MAG: malto-oligosyltrehalose synthase [Gammaproteobacteria bacterium]|nr:malto-oligosyltrehalose synthase [Gammaproteobacteria bacterium]
MAYGRIPLATYRLQFNRQFTFDDAAALIPYLRELGVSHCYASPYLRARSGSPHGYDIVDHSSLNPEIGSERSFHRYLDALAKHNMGQILDLVPNHMGVGGDDNAWWLDVLENGPASAYATYFDIDWFPIKEELRGKVLVPVLGGHYGNVLENGELRLTFDARRGEFSVWYYNHRFPLEPRTYPRVMEYRIEQLSSRLGAEHPRLAQFLTLTTAFGHLPSRWETVATKLDERRRDKEVHKQQLVDLCAKSPEIGAFLDENVQLINGDPGEPASFDLLHDILEEQVYRLAYWQVASDEINYRRFFDINDLAGLRMEIPDVFNVTHRFVLQLVADGRLDGLRIDHPDGLYDPPDYYARLQTEVQAALPAYAGPVGPAAVPEFYFVAEKILASYERLVDGWPVHGTTGYDFMNLVNGLFVHADAAEELERTYARFLGHHPDFDEVLYQSKRLVIDVQLSSELTVLSNMLDDIAQRNRYTRDFTLNGCRNALTVLVACFPVYRTYIAENRVSDDDRRYVDWAVAQAKKRSPAADVSIFDFICDLLVVETRSDDPMRRAHAARFAMKLQQYTAPVMAKAMEDTSFYLYHRLVSLNEVGGDPRRFGTSVTGFHHANLERARNWSHSMLATSTHDSKRGEDVRARIDVISELADEWRAHVTRWARLARTRKLIVDGAPAPSRNDEYLFYQTLLGAWPLEPVDERGFDEFRERIKRYMLKAVKEAKAQTSWINPNAAYEEAVCHFVTVMLNNTGQNPFLADFLPFQQRIARFGLWNSLAQTLLKFTAPGVPDIYQGNEIWDFSLVDPDNRRPVDYRRRRDLLRRVVHGAKRLSGVELAGELMENLNDGRAKLYVTWRALALRRSLPDVFLRGDYQPLAADGPQAAHVVAFARRHEQDVIAVLVPRCMAMLTGDDRPPVGAAVWTETYVEAPDHLESFHNVLTGEELVCEEIAGQRCLPVAQALGHFPLALLQGRHR